MDIKYKNTFLSIIKQIKNEYTQKPISDFLINEIEENLECNLKIFSNSLLKKYFKENSEVDIKCKLTRNVSDYTIININIYLNGFLLNYLSEKQLNNNKFMATIFMASRNEKLGPNFIKFKKQML